ncbi:alkene reductase [Thioclava atlantica]|uniref:N-ethylmaleimide reductase n=1 Tax=Thioclava atlantica TaxID=1317124 RepID=A0A085TWD3_9RHOB|nr:alkene reductase [Thioclava atlantica]KFE35030.1 N-ethylmaleimide reductase [Thioclava atlantica]
MTETLFTPTKLGAIEIANRFVMAPLTRNRAPELVPTEMMIEYYRQRASAGLIVTEGTQISPMGQGYAWTPGIHDDAQVAGWRKITDAVHEAGGKIAAQLWHVGRVSAPAILGGKDPVAPSAISAQAKTFDGESFIETTTPHALSIEEIQEVLAQYRNAAEKAKAAGFDGVEIHAANGYLIDQFLRDTSNTRDDAYGGPIENRIRFLREVVETVVDVWGPGRVGIRLSPWSNANNVGIDSNTAELFGAVVDFLNTQPMAFVHLVEGQTGGARDWPEGGIETLRTKIAAPYIANNGYSHEMAEQALADGASAVAFGKLFIANPDLPERFEKGAPLNEPNPATFYGGGAEGYTDYPALA